MMQDGKCSECGQELVRPPWLENPVRKALAEFQAFKAEVEPQLFAAGWVKDDEGPLVPNPFEPKLPLRRRYRDPDSGLYFNINDALRIVLGQEPRLEGVAKETEENQP